MRRVKKSIFLLGLCVLFTGCESVKEESPAVNEDISSISKVADVGESADETTGSGDEDYYLYEEFVADIQKAAESGSFDNLDISSAAKESLGKKYEGRARDWVDICGYLEEDLDGNGIKELIIGSNDYMPETEVMDFSGSSIYDIFTVKDGQMEHVFKREDGEACYFGTDKMIVREIGDFNSDDGSYSAMFCNYVNDNLEVSEKLMTSGTDYVCTDEKSGTEKTISWEEISEFVKKNCNGNVEFIKFKELPKASKKVVHVFWQEDETGYGIAFDERFKRRIKLYEDHTGIEHYADIDVCFTWDDEKLTYTGVANPSGDNSFFDSDMVGSGDKIDGLDTCYYKIEGNTVKMSESPDFKECSVWNVD